MLNLKDPPSAFIALGNALLGYVRGHPEPEFKRLSAMVARAMESADAGNWDDAVLFMQEACAAIRCSPFVPSEKR